ncbi:MAG TPA: PKD domain-containing protein, partial [Candidatus Paceibacterota bacterium]
IVADKIYTGAMSNSGETLTLKDKNGAVIDKVLGGGDWQNIGGDNATKQTPQRLSSSAWTTATATPKAKTPEAEEIILGEVPANPPSPSPVISPASPQSSPSPQTGSINWPVEPQIYANAGPDRILIAGADSLFSGKALGIKKEPLEGARYLWNFGDGGVKEGQNVSHIYQYPGEYMVSLEVSSLRYSAADYLLARVTNNELKITEANKDYIKLHNGSPNRLDVSGWIIKAENESFTFPSGTLVKEKTSIIIPASISGISAEAGSGSELLYPNGSKANVFSVEDGAQTKITESGAGVLKEIEISSEPVPKKNITVEIAPSPNGAENKSSENAITEDEGTQTAALKLANDGSPRSVKKWLILAVFSGIVGGVSIVAVRKKQL